MEVRVPFLDRDFLDVAMTLDPQDKMIRKADGRMEKYILRKVTGDSILKRREGAMDPIRSQKGDSAIAGPRLFVSSSRCLLPRHQTRRLSAVH